MRSQHKEILKLSTI